MDESEVKKYWSNTLKELERLAEKGLINEGDIEPYLFKLMSVSTMYELRRENNPFKLLNKIHEKRENTELEKVVKMVKRLLIELNSNDYFTHLSNYENFTHPAIPPLIESLNQFIRSTSIPAKNEGRGGNGKQVKLSKHELFRVFEMIYNHYAKNAKLSKFIPLANEFFSAAGYIPESSNEKELDLKKQDFDIARETLKKAGISDNQLFVYLTF